MITYGQLSEQPFKNLSAIDLYEKNVKIEPFFLPFWLKDKSAIQYYQIV
jgi:hypothetical protein